MGAMASQITSISSVYSTVCSGVIKENPKAPRHWPLWPVNSPHKGTVTRKMFPFDGVIMRKDIVWTNDSTKLIFTGSTIKLLLSFAVISDVYRSFIPNKTKFSSAVLLSGFQTHRELWNPLSKEVPGKFHGFDRHNKRNCLQDRATLLHCTDDKMSEQYSFQWLHYPKAARCDDLKSIRSLANHSIYWSIGSVNLLISSTRCW